MTVVASEDALTLGARLGWCRQPVQLRQTRTTVDRTTGSVLAKEATDHYVTCKTRRSSDCPPCSRLYGGDAYHLILTGLTGGKGMSASVATSTALVVTLTAPGAEVFGVGHHFRDKHGHRRCHPGSRERVCEHGTPLRCGRRHDEDDPLLGAPLCSECFDYQAAVAWNRALPELWRRWTIYVRRELKHRDVDVQYVRTVEPQRRGLMHIHAVVRFDTPDGVLLHPAVAEDAVIRAAGRVSTPVGQRFGEQVHVRPVRLGGGRGDLARRQAAGYLAKYATGSAVDLTAKTGGLTPHLLRMRDTAAAAFRRELRAKLRDQQGVGLLNLTEREEQRLAERAERRARELGYRGHFLSKSRSYSTTFTALREARRAHHADGQAPVVVPDVAAVATWTFVGQGYRTEHRRVAVAVWWLTRDLPPSRGRIAA